MNLYWAGREVQAFDMFGRVQAFATIPGALDYLMVARGVFKEDTKRRVQPMEPEAPKLSAGAGGGARKAAPLTDSEKQSIRKDLSEYLGPFLIA
jgi:hypothetical protein